MDRKALIMTVAAVLASILISWTHVNGMTGDNGTVRLAHSSRQTLKLWARPSIPPKESAGACWRPRQGRDEFALQI